jgi:hypothetical protein
MDEVGFFVGMVFELDRTRRFLFFYDFSADFKASIMAGEEGLEPCICGDDFWNHYIQYL